MLSAVLLVEDDPTQGPLIKQLLEMHSLEVVLVTGVEEAEKVIACSEQHFMAGVFDFNVNGGTTEEIVRKFMITEPFAATINISGDSAARQKLGCRYEYPKPFSIKHFLELFDTLALSA